MKHYSMENVKSTGETSGECKEKFEEILSLFGEDLKNILKRF